jgi:hypothetical protein
LRIGHLPKRRHLQRREQERARAAKCECFLSLFCIHCFHGKYITSLCKQSQQILCEIRFYVRCLYVDSMWWEAVTMLFSEIYVRSCEIDAQVGYGCLYVWNSMCSCQWWEAVMMLLVNVMWDAILCEIGAQVGEMDVFMCGILCAHVSDERQWRCS